MIFVFLKIRFKISIFQGANGSTVGTEEFGFADTSAGFTGVVINPADYIGIGTVNPIDSLDVQGGNMSDYSLGGHQFKN
ncbi:hypothetical protein [Mucilaginibacter glaciei]|uniref:Uncharacterized protein n=1 Tax=Mucilaginibacter glaciei TaxID=2772109 RepID=A0A926S2S2_9SPHI|nr:hypothetical protein [Mucilaginibacter glaciei]MBD1395440.1 hypothetical protein [Mucilaginibacter glaciei]